MVFGVSWFGSSVGVSVCGDEGPDVGSSVWFSVVSAIRSSSKF